VNVKGLWRRLRRPREGGPHLRTEDLSAFADGSLPPARAAVQRAHVEACRQCGRAVEELRAVRRLLASLGTAEALRAFRVVEPSGQRVRPRMGGAFGAFAGTAAAAAVVVFGVLVAYDVARSGGGPADRASESPSLARVAEDMALTPGAGARAVAPGAASPEAAGAEAPGPGDRAQPSAGKASGPAMPSATGESQAIRAAASPTPPGGTLAASGDNGGRGSDAGLRAAEIIAGTVAIAAAGAAGWWWYQRRKAT
jgi:hypothetical protein